MIAEYVKDMKREFAGYNGKKLTQDLMAGLTVCAVALPLALAFGVSSGATAASGLVTAIVAGIVIAILGGASYQISGPTGAMSAVLIAIVVQYGLQGVFFSCFAAGIVLLLCGIFRLGRLISFIPMPVVMGFTSGIAILIAQGQIDNFFGTVSEGESTLEQVASYSYLGFNPDMETTAIGILVVLIMVFWPKKWGAKVPGSLVGIIVATAVTAIMGLENPVLVGEIPKTLFLDDRLSLSSLNFDMISHLASPIVTISALAMIESLLCGASASRMKGEHFCANRELVAQGVGNIVLPFFGGVPATAAIARTSVAIRSGGLTRLTSIFHSLFLLLSMFLLGDVMAKLPMSALAGVLMVTAFRMNEWAGIKYILSHKFKSAISQFLLTMVATVVFDLTVSIILGVMYSAILHMTKTHVVVNFSDIDPARFHGDQTEVPQNTCVAYVTGSLFFGATSEFTEAFEDAPACTEMIFSLRGMPSIDVSGGQCLLELIHDLQSKGVEVLFCGVTEEVRTFFDRAGVTEAVGGGEAFYWSADLALLAVTHKQKAEGAEMWFENHEHA